MEVSGSFKNLSATAAREFQPGQKLTGRDIIAEVLRVGAPVPSIIRLTAGTSTLTMPVAGQWDVPAALRVGCYTEIGGDASVRCMVPGPQHAAPVAPDSMLTLPAAQGWVGFQISSVALSLTPTVVNLRVTFVTSPEVAAMVAAGDVDADAVAYASSIRATIAAVNERHSAGGQTVIDATLSVPAALGPSGWIYGNQLLKAGLGFRFETVRYVISGQVTGMKTPVPVQPQ